MGICPQDLELPYETTVKDISYGPYGAFGDGTYGFWTEHTVWKFIHDMNYEIY